MTHILQDGRQRVEGECGGVKEATDRRERSEPRPESDSRLGGVG